MDNYFKETDDINLAYSKIYRPFSEKAINRMAESLAKSVNKIFVKRQENPALNDFEKKYVSSVSGLTRYSAVYGWGVGVAGFLFTWGEGASDSDNIYITTIYVDSEYRGKGIATKLIQKVIDSNSDKNIIINPVPFADKPHSKDELTAIYKHLGFVEYPFEKDSLYIPKE